MHSITYIGTETDLSDSVTIDGVTYDRFEAVSADSVHPWIKDNPTFSVEDHADDAGDEKPVEDKPVEKPVVKTVAKKPVAKKAVDKGAE